MTGENTTPIEPHDHVMRMVDSDGNFACWICQSEMFE